MRSRGVENARRCIAEAIDEGDRLARGIIRQAEDSDIDVAQQRGLGGRILALLLVAGFSSE